MIKDILIVGLCITILIFFALGVISVFQKNVIVTHRVIERQELTDRLICQGCGYITEKKDLCYDTMYSHFIDGKLVPASKIDDVLKKVR